MKWESEAALCEAFIETVPKDWTVYPETGDFDMVLVHRTGGQIGVEAKLVLNVKVLLQVLEGLDSRYHINGPDFRAVLVGSVPNGMASLAKRLGVTVIGVERYRPHGPMNCQRGKKWMSQPNLPDLAKYEARHFWLGHVDWIDLAPARRLPLPEYVPDVRAGVPSPMVLGKWKIQAIKLCIWLERHHYISRAQFTAFQINASRWMDGHWLRKTGTRGVWEAGQHFPGPQFKAEHPTVWDQVEADYEKWSAKVPSAPSVQKGALL